MVIAVGDGPFFGERYGVRLALAALRRVFVGFIQNQVFDGFVGQAGKSYAFRLRSWDTNNQPELWPSDDASETSATLPASCILDVFEPNDTLAQARVLPLNVLARGNLCEAGNPDWFRIDVENTNDYYVTAKSEYGGAAVSLTVYAADGETILASGQAAGIGQGTIVH